MNQAPAEDGKWSINVTAGQQKVHVGRVSEDDDRLASGSPGAEPGVGFPELGEGEDLCRSQVGMSPCDLVEEGLEACLVHIAGVEAREIAIGRQVHDRIEMVVEMPLSAKLAGAAADAAFRDVGFWPPASWIT